MLQVPPPISVTVEPDPPVQVATSGLELVKVTGIS